MKDGRHIIWSNDIDYDDWREDLEEQYPDLTEAERMELMYELNSDYLTTSAPIWTFSSPVPFSLSVIWGFGTAVAWGIRRFRAAISGTAFTANGT